MKIHYATSAIPGDLSSMKFKDMEKLTGGNYKICNIPTENKKMISEFYQKLKKLKVPFSELPDLNLGDGFTQIAFDPNDADKIRLVSDFFKEKLQKEAEEITVEQYEKMGEDKLKELASMGYEKESQMEQLSSIRQRNEDKNFVPISINRESLQVHETKDAYMVRLPQSLHQGNSEYVVKINKEDALLLDQGQTIYTHIDVTKEVSLYERDRRTEKMTDAAKTESGGEISKHFAKVDKKTVDKTGHIRLDQTEHFPNFNEGEELLLSSPSPEEKKIVSLQEKRVQGKNQFQNFPQRNYKKEDMRSLEQALLQGKTENVSYVAENRSGYIVDEILKREELKTKSNSEDYIPVSFDRQQIASETKDAYMVKISSESPDDMCVAVIDKKDCSAKGNQVTAFLKKEGKSECFLIDKKTGAKRNEKLAVQKLAARAKKQMPMIGGRPVKLPELGKGGRVR